MRVDSSVRAGSKRAAAAAEDPDQDVACEVCLDGSWDNSNLIVFCEGKCGECSALGYNLCVLCGLLRRGVSCCCSCHPREATGIAVHQRCYGIPVVPSGDWLCDVCAQGEVDIAEVRNQSQSFGSSLISSFR